MNEQVARLDCSDLDGDVTWRKGRKEGPLLIVVMGGVGGEEGDREPFSSIVFTGTRTWLKGARTVASRSNCGRVAVVALIE